MSTFPAGFEMPKSSGNFLKKLEEGTTKLKFLEPPILGWVKKIYPEPDSTGKIGKPEIDYWFYSEQPKQPHPKADIFLACLVYNFKEQTIQYFELEKKSLLSDLLELEKSGYDLTQTDFNFIKKGNTKENTKYSIVPSPKTETLSDEVLETYKNMDVNLSNAFINNGNPFGAVEENQTTPTISNVKMPDINIDDINIQMPF